MNIIQRYQKAKVIFIAYHFYPKGGSTVSANHYHQYWTGRGEVVEKISKDSRFGFIRILIAFFFGKKVIMNGLYCFYFWDLILFTCFRKDTVIYLQEAEDAIKHFQANAPYKYKIVKKLLRRNRVACISALQENYLKQHLGAERTQLVYNTLPFIKQITPDSSFVKILMAGYLMSRKGVSFYSELADYAKKKNEAWKFYWLGNGNPKGLYLSENVEWLGYQSNPHFYFDKIDVFFLSSIDEPLGLVCAEALMHHKKCVVYKNSGFAELIENIEGCAIYDQYKIEDAYQALQKAIHQPLDTEKTDAVLNSKLSVEKFSENFDQWLLL
ncbi:glycosyltransferase family 4 protein [Catalinimonas sp. 4WD22]|uniref:glycosyltransferase family 4 protein n=1 Tax=Catalinimonas locisalis TaxID=3133978 RepID=UPI0031017BDC